jgi:hypothetical protein
MFSHRYLRELTRYGYDAMPLELIAVELTRRYDSLVRRLSAKESVSQRTEIADQVDDAPRKRSHSENFG